MVNETIDIDSHNFDFHFENANQQQQIVVQQQQQKEEYKKDLLPLQRSCSGYDSFGQKDQLRDSKDLLISPLNEAATKLLTNTSADNLSWTFFEQVSSVDNHLRLNESSSTSSIAAIQLMTIATNDVNSMIADGQHQHLVDQQQPPHLLTIPNLSNGTTKKKILAVDIVSQQSPDIIQQQQQQQQQQEQKQQRHKRTYSTINAIPTKAGTLRQNQIQNHQQNHQQNQEQNHSENQQQNHQSQQNHQNPIHPQQSHNNNQTILATKTKQNNHHTQQSEETPEKSPNNNSTHKTIAYQLSYNERSTAMITSAGIEADNVTAATVGTTRSARIRNLPAITKLTPTYASGVDLVGGTNQTARPERATRKAREALNSRKNMGAASQSFVDGLETHLGLKGWRKKCLYTLLVMLMLLIIVNLVLTLWILKVMEFSTEGMGQLKIIPGGIQLTGQALIMDMLRASTIRSRHGQPISIESSRNFSINTRDRNGVLENQLFLGHDKLECLATGFRINDTTGRNLFSVNRDEVTIGAHALRIDGEGGAIFRESIQTPHIRAEPGRELRLESPTRQLELTAAKDINLQSRAGGIELTALEDVKLSALDGSLRFESSKILMPNLRTAQPPLPGQAQSREHLHRVFQLCACSNGKLFLAAPHSICAGDESTVCR